MVATLKEAQKKQEMIMQLKAEGKSPPCSVEIYREIHYYADINGARYALMNDWETQCVTAYIDKYFKEQTKD